MKSIRIAFFAILVGLITALVGARIMSAQDPLYTGMDILFVVDQSGSMGGRLAGSTDHPEPNDPNGLRFYGVDYAMSWLGRNLLLLHPGATYRMAVINFGSEAQALNLGTADAPYYWETINPATEKQWQVQEATLKQKLAPGTLATTNMRNTNFLAAFDLAQRLFERLDAQGGAKSGQKRAIVILTDGQPFVSEDNFSVDAHMGKLVNLVKSSFPSPQYSLYVVALNDADIHYWNDVYASYWAKVTGATARARLVEQNRTDVGIRFRQILLELTQDLPGKAQASDVEILAGPRIVPPYLREIEFTFFKANVSETTIVTDALGQNIKALGPAQGVQVSGQTGPIEKVQVRNPSPGRWTVVVPVGSETKITMQQIPAQGNLEQPVGLQYQSVPVQVVYQLVDSSNNPLPEYRDQAYQLQVTTTVQAGGQSWPITLRSAGQSRYEAEFVPTQLGSHTVHVTAASSDLNGKRIVIFDGDLNPFSVQRLSTESRAGGNRLTQYVSSTLRYNLVDGNKQIANVSAPLEVQAIITDSQNRVSTIPLVVQQGHELAGDFTPATAGVHQVRLIAKARDSRGQQYSVLDTQQSPVDVVSPKMQVQVSPPPFRQYVTVTVNVQIRDAAGNPLVLDTNYQPKLALTLSGNGREQSVSAQQSAPGSFAASFAPSRDGAQTLISTLKVVNAATGLETTVAENRQDIFVAATTVIDVRATDATLRWQPVRSILFQPEPLVIELEMTANGKPVELSQVTGASADQMFSLRVLDEKGIDRTSEVVWKPTDRTGHVRAESKTLGIGEYAVQVQTAASVKPDYVLSRRSLQFNVRRVENPVLVGLGVLSLAALTSGLIIAGVVTKRSIDLKKHPCRGYLVLVDSTRRILKNIVLDSDQASPRNQQTFDIGLLAPLSLVETLKVACASDEQSRSGIVMVEAMLSNGDRVGPYALGPHAAVPLVPGTTWIIKDQEASDLEQIPVEASPIQPTIG